jgi:hypothetical protein
MRYRLLRILLAVLLFSLVPAAHASSPDETWISGLYDNADYDDAVLAVVGSVASLDRPPLHGPEDVDLVVASIRLIDESRHAMPPLSSTHTRAPPAS